MFGSDGQLYVNSEMTSSVLRYDGSTGAFIDVFASGGGLEEPLDLLFGPDGNLYVTSEGTDEVLLYDGTTGTFLDVFASGGGIDESEGLGFGPDGNLSVVSEATDEVYRYEGTTGAFIDIFIEEGSGGLAEPTFLTFGPDAVAVSEPAMRFVPGVLLLAMVYAGRRRTTLRVPRR